MGQTSFIFTGAMGIDASAFVQQVLESPMAFHPKSSQSKIEKTIPKILIKLLKQRNQLFSLSKDKIRIGRGDDAELILPNVSVSRTHAIIE